MGVVTRYFDVSAAGAGDGTSWANRAALFSGGNWSTVITGHDFSSDSLQVFIGPGTYTCNQTLSSGLFSVAAPSVLRPISLISCDASGDRWEPPDATWTSARPVWDVSGMPVIQCGTSLTVNLSSINNIRLYGLRLTSGPSGLFASIVGTGELLDWCVVDLVCSSGNSQLVNLAKVQNSVFRNHVSTTWNEKCVAVNSSRACDNVRCEQSVVNNSSSAIVFGDGGISRVSRCTAVGFAKGFWQTNSVATASFIVDRCLAWKSDNVGTAFYYNSNASPLTYHNLIQSVAVGFEFAIRVGASDPTYISNTWVRGYTTETSGTVGSMPRDLSTWSSTDDSDFVSSATGDFRIKYGSPLWGLGVGVEDEPAPSGGGGVSFLPHPLGRF